MKSPLRDLADLIDIVAHSHPAYGQGQKIVANCIDHLCAVARIEEANREIAELRKKD